MSSGLLRGVPMMVLLAASTILLQAQAQEPQPKFATHLELGGVLRIEHRTVVNCEFCIVNCELRESHPC
jgi:hypothetical protein